MRIPSMIGALALSMTLFTYGSASYAGENCGAESCPHKSEGAEGGEGGCPHLTEEAAKLAAAATATADGSVTQIFPVEGMTCAGCEASISGALKKIDGVSKVEASHVKKQVSVSFDPKKVQPKAIVDAINKLGEYKASMPVAAATPPPAEAKPAPDAAKPVQPKEEKPQGK
jgi:copper chaperone CopZ